MIEEERQPLDGAKAEAKTLSPISLRVAHLVELLKDHFQVFWGDADAGVMDFKAYGGCPGAAANQHLP